MPSRLKLALVFVSLLFVSTFAVACSGDDEGGSGTSPTAAPTSRPAATSAPAATTAPTAAAAAPTAAGGATGNSVTIADFSYNPARLNARAGQPVSLAVRNDGNAPHTFTITGVVDSGTLSGGQSRTVTFTPAAAGTLTYFCAIHGQATMSGQITVAGATGALPPDAPSGGQTTAGSASAPASAPATGYEGY